MSLLGPDATHGDKAKGAAVFVAIGVLSFAGWLGWSTHLSSDRSAVIAQEVKALLTDGKTTSAIDAKKTENLEIEIKALIQGGKTIGAEQSKDAATLARNASVLAQRAVVALRAAQTALSNELSTFHGSSVATNMLTQKILCRFAADVAPGDPALAQLCSKT